MLTDDAPPDKESKSRKMTALAVTALAHLVIFGFAGIIAVIPAIREEPDIIAEVLGPVEENPLQKPKNSLMKQAEVDMASAAQPIANLLRSNSIASIAAPDVSSADTPLGLGKGELGVGFGSGAKNLGSGAMFFGQKVEGKLGVVFDVSGSMTEYVPLVTDELKRSFRNSIVVCANSSAFTIVMGEPEVVPWTEADRTNTVKPRILTPETEKMDRDLSSLPNCYILTSRNNALGHGIEYLMNQGIQNIFVFSDFQDTYNGLYLDKLTAEVMADKVKVNLQLLVESDGGQREEYLRNLARKSGGSFSVGELVRRAGR